MGLHGQSGGAANNYYCLLFGRDGIYGLNTYIYNPKENTTRTTFADENGGVEGRGKNHVSERSGGQRRRWFDVVGVKGKAAVKIPNKVKKKGKKHPSRSGGKKKCISRESAGLFGCVHLCVKNTNGKA